MGGRQSGSAKRMEIDITADYLRKLAPFTDGNQALTDALNGAAHKIAALQAERDGLKNVLEKVRDDLMLRAEDAPDGARVVAVGNGVWFSLNKALEDSENE